MPSHFTAPQRQSKVGVLVMFLDTMRQYAKAFWPILVLWIFKFNEINKIWLFIGFASIFVIVGLTAYLKYRNFLFYLDYENEEFVINEGVFNKTRTTIQLHKIQQVNINQSLLQKIIGVYALDVDTAGSNNKEGEIKAISYPLAIELKARLLDNSKKTRILDTLIADETEAVPETAPFIRIGFLSLVKVGLTSNYVKSFGLLLIFFFSVSEHINRFTGRDLFHDEDISSYVDTNKLVQVFLIGLAFLFIVVLAINLIRIIVRYFDYKIAKQKGSLLLSFGLINTKSTIIKPEKVQIATVSQNYFQKKLDILQLRIKQATSGEKEARKSAIEIPGCNAAERDAILTLLFGKIPQKGVMLKPNFRKLGFALFLTIGLPLLGFYLFRHYSPELGLMVNYLVLVYVLFVGLIEFFKFRNNRLFIHNDFIIKQSGAWDISHEIIEPMKIQAVTTSQLFWHKSINIGSLTLHTAGGNIAFQLGDYNALKQHINRWLYEIETSDSNWM